MGALTGLLGVGGGAGGTTFGGPQMASQQGNNNMQTAYNMLQGVASGTGPNPAQDQYNANIQNLAKQQAGAIASVQGISPALATRMASQQGSAAMQNAAAQGQANTAAQQLGAMGQMGNIGGMQQGAANQMMASMNQTNAGLAQTTMQGQQGVIGGLFGGAGTAMGAGAPAAADGGQAGVDFSNPVQQYSAPAMNIPVQAQQQNGQAAQTRSLLSQFLSGGGNNQQPISGPAAIAKGMTTFGAGLHNQFAGSPAPVDSSGGESDMPSPYGQDAVMPSGNPIGPAYGLGFGANPVAPPGMAMGGMTKDYRSGGNVKASSPKQKAVKSGNSYANDKIPAVLSEGEVVLPRSVMQSADPIRSSADFVAKVIAKRRAGK